MVRRRSRVWLLQAVIAPSHALERRVEEKGMKMPAQLRFLQIPGGEWLQGGQFLKPVPHFRAGRTSDL